jgi:glycogen debranching enzyme
MIFGFGKNEKIKEQSLKEIKELKDKKGFLRAGFPRFSRLFGRDSLISAWQLLDYNPGICQATLEILSQFQGKVFNNDREEEPGKIIHETDTEKKNNKNKVPFPYPYYGSIDSTPLFLILFGFYYQRTKDVKFLERHWGNILMALNWLKECGDKDKDLYIKYERKNQNGLFHQGWKDSFKDHLKILPPVAIVEAQGYQYLALKEVSNLAKQVKKDIELKDELDNRAKKLKDNFNKDFWMEDKKYFALALDKDNKQRQAITSNPGHLLFTGILNKDRADLVVKRMFEKDMFTGFGIRTHSRLEFDFDPKSYHLGSIWPHDNWIIAKGLKKLGYEKEYNKIKRAILLALEKIGFLPELYGVVGGELTLDLNDKPCYPQAWASGALFDFVSS